MTAIQERHEGALPQGPDVVVVSGMSGAGRTEALHALEDLGYFCIDNLPANMIVPLVDLVGLPIERSRRLAVVCDVRSEEFFLLLKGELEKLDAKEVSYEVLFLDATDAVLRNRYSSLRRRHPLAREGLTVSGAIEREREVLGSIREQAHVVIDTSDMRAQELRRRVTKEFSDAPGNAGINVSVFSFGFKYGLPIEADLVIDVRFLPNPYYHEDMRELSGFDAPVRDFVLSSQDTQAFLAAWFNLLDVVMPGYVNEGKQHLSIAVGCTGGQHRSVALAEATAARLVEQGYKVSVSHRDLRRHVDLGGLQ